MKVTSQIFNKIVWSVVQFVGSKGACSRADTPGWALAGWLAGRRVRATVAQLAARPGTAHKSTLLEMTAAVQQARCDDARAG